MPKSSRVGGDHFYTTSTSERDKSALNGYNYECVACYTLDSPGQGTVPLYRLYNLKTQKHFYTTSATERDESVARNGFRDEGIAGYVFDAPVEGVIPLYRLFHPRSLNHFYTTSPAERDESVAQNGFRDEGIAGYVSGTEIKGTIALYRLYNVAHARDLDKIMIFNVQFDFNQMKLDPLPDTSSALSQELSNNSDEKQQTEAEMEIGYTETQKWSTNFGIKAGVESNIRSGVPCVMEGEAKVTGEVTSSITLEEEVSEQKSIKFVLHVTVAPHSKVICRGSMSKAKVSVPYSADAIYHFRTGQELRGRFTGTFSGDRAYHLKASWA
jgi:hypothetical protein